MTEKGGALEEAFRFLTEIGIIAQLAGTAFEKAMPEGMTMPQFVVLNHLARLGGEWTPLRLANAMQLTKGAMTNTLGHLIRKNFVAVRPDDRDGRSKLVSLTAEGLAARDRAIAALAPELAALVEGVSAELLTEAIPPLETVRRFLDRRRDRPSDR
ncbi:MarR family transcriptional regulator [Mesorhizobium sp. L-8-10]|uniref:MarR family winged helix-turn-helix transcriptional regulator n=1 Tax=Mesorhizobium sp. L-8-10 TaxID=2744523 RepID=UPI0019285B2A|nr:MarR family transcriptional regulator [Mesorhizobium sp. L-8-10]BCH31887.1 MarR family transcriptional regulator [Mesorhizobium sp. L-8-10]